MNKQRTVEVVQREIDALQDQLESVQGTVTEVYTRIVGYYRSVSRWNKGKRSEFNFRRNFNFPTESAMEKVEGRRGESVSTNCVCCVKNRRDYTKNDGLCSECRKASQRITHFLGRFHFLSNMYLSSIFIEGRNYRSVEHYYQSQKSTERTEQNKVWSVKSPYDARKVGRSLPLRDDWEKVKNRVMYRAVRAKFVQHADLRKRLISTESAELLEGNSWGDVYWGVNNKTLKGKNILGKILMRVRSEVSRLPDTSTDFSIKITKAVILEYKNRLKNIGTINENARKRYLQLLRDYVETRNRAGVFQIISFVEDWSSRDRVIIHDKLIDRKG